MFTETPQSKVLREQLGYTIIANDENDETVCDVADIPLLVENFDNDIPEFVLNTPLILAPQDRIPAMHAVLHTAGFRGQILPYDLDRHETLIGCYNAHLSKFPDYWAGMIKRCRRPKGSIADLLRGYKAPPVVMPLPIPAVNDFFHCGGIPFKTVHVVAAPPGKYKTALALQIGIQAAKAGYLTYFISDDEAPELLAVRAAQSVGEKRGSFFQGWDPSAPIRAANQLDELPLYLRSTGDLVTADWHAVDSSPEITVESIADEMIAFAPSGECVLIVDMLDTASVKAAAEERDENEAMRKRMRVYAALARRGFLIILLAPKNKASWREENLSCDAELATVKGSTAIGHTASSVMTLSSVKDDSGGLVKLRIVKSRIGGTDSSVYLRFDPETSALSQDTSLAAETQTTVRDDSIEESIRNLLREERIATKSALTDRIPKRKSDVLDILNQLLASRQVLPPLNGFRPCYVLSGNADATVENEIAAMKSRILEICKKTPISNVDLLRPYMPGTTKAVISALLEELENEGKLSTATAPWRVLP